MNKSILVSLALIAAVGVIATGATISYFTDIETSTGNTFTAGSIELKINNECHWSGGGDCPWHNVVNPDDPDKIMLANWEESDLIDGVHKFFYFTDLKPGDWGEDTISIHVYDNNAWGRIYFSDVVSLDNTCVDPEIEDEPNCTLDDSGELDDEMTVKIWLDQGEIPGFQNCIDPNYDPFEGDNIWQGLYFEPLVLADITDDFSYSLSDIIMTAYQMPGGSEGNGLTADGHMIGCVTYYLGVAWCLGDWVYEPGTGTMVCDGLPTTNISQTDSLSGDVTFEVEQYRNNPVPSWDL